MVIVVDRLPVSTTDITKLMTTPTGHVIAPLILLDHDIALLASLVIEVFDQQVGLILITVSPVGLHEAFFAKTMIANVADHRLSLKLPFPDGSLATLSGAHFAGWIFECQVEDMKLSVFLLNFQR